MPAPPDSSPHRYLDRDKLAAHLKRKRVPAKTRDEILSWIDRQPTQPVLLGVTAAAREINVPPSRIARYREDGRMPAPWVVDGGYDVWPADVIETFAEEDKARRREWAARRGLASSEA